MRDTKTAGSYNRESDLTHLLAQSIDIINDGIHIINRNGVTVFYSRGLEKIERNKASSV